ncbi:MAG: HAD family hydrolase [Campylobacterota bacterium]|nr:HAD family hydrolase [Campylobacterota bacterium]
MTILFDLDGTLIDSTEAILESFHNSYRVHERPSPDNEAIKALIGHPLDVMYRELGIEEAMVWTFVDTYKAHYRKISCEKTVLLECARDAIEEASKFARLGIVTTKTGKYSRELLEHFGVMHYFEVLIGREDVENPKPHPEPIHKALEMMACDKKHCWMIGDTRLDVEAAQNASIECVAVSSGYDNVEELSKLIDIIEKDALKAVRFIADKGKNNT